MRSCLAALVGSLAVAVAVPAGGSPSPSDTTGLAWSTRPLAWSDYRGAPDFSTDASATTVCEIAYEEACEGDAFSFTVVSMFRRDRSWVRPTLFETPARAARLLDHEQGHFDLSEVLARSLRQRLTSLTKPCQMKKDDRHNLIRRQVRDDAQMQARYDRETNFGRDRFAQAHWSSTTSRSLTQLAAWVR
jgi:hypothetical protein